MFPPSRLDLIIACIASALGQVDNLLQALNLQLFSQMGKIKIKHGLAQRKTLKGDSSRSCPTLGKVKSPTSSRVQMHGNVGPL